jgi:glycosyltransferase involved in cell wall biosynthesis
MNICIVGSSKRFFSGISAYTIVQANAFARQGHRVSAVLLRNLVPTRLYPGRGHIGKGDFLLKFLDSIAVYEGLDWNSPRTWVRAGRFIRETNPDAVIMHWWTSSVAHMQLYLALSRLMTARGLPLILEMHEVVDPLEENILPIRLYSRVAGRLLLKLSNMYVAHSEEARQRIIKTYHIPESLIWTVPHGPYNVYGTIDKQEAKRVLRVDGFVILYFGMIRRYKGVSLLLKAFSSLPDDIVGRMTLVIAGEDWGDDGDLKPCLESNAHRDRIVYLPEFIPDERLPYFFSSADLVVLPYTRSCGSGVANIASAQGKGVLMSDIPTLLESFGDYRGARFFPAGDVEALRGSLLDAYQEWRTGGRANFSYIDDKWSDIITSFEGIIKGRSRS